MDLSHPIQSWVYGKGSLLKTEILFMLACGEFLTSVPLRTGPCPKAFWSQVPILSYEENWSWHCIYHFLLSFENTLGECGNLILEAFWILGFFNPKSFPLARVWHPLGLWWRAIFPSPIFHPLLNLVANFGWIHLILFFLTQNSCPAVPQNPMVAWISSWNFRLGNFLKTQKENIQLFITRTKRPNFP